MVGRNKLVVSQSVRMCIAESTVHNSGLMQKGIYHVDSSTQTPFVLRSVLKDNL